MPTRPKKSEKSSNEKTDQESLEYLEAFNILASKFTDSELEHRIPSRELSLLATWETSLLEKHHLKITQSDFLSEYDKHFVTQGERRYAKSLDRIEKTPLDIPTVIRHVTRSPYIKHLKNNRGYKRKRCLLCVDNDFEDSLHLQPEIYAHHPEPKTPPFGSHFPVPPTVVHTVDIDRARKKQKTFHSLSTSMKFMFDVMPSSIDKQGETIKLAHRSEPNEFVQLFHNVMEESFNFHPKQSLSDYMHEMEEQNSSLKQSIEKLKIERDKEKAMVIKKKWAQVTEQLPQHFKDHLSRHANNMKECRKLAQKCQSEVIAKLRTSQKLSRDAPIRAKKMNKEMVTFWRKHEKELGEKRKRRLKEEGERKKREEEMEEAKRQQRKLNFLLTQTELYSHFMARKTFPTQSEALTGQIAIADEDKEAAAEGMTSRMALEKAEKAALAQQQATREFDMEISKYCNHIPTSLNSQDFQDPSTLLTSERIQVPSIFRGSLKNYQYKGFRWLVSLYDQGINGILADEMGLGKTVQTIAFMSHLAESKNIWGPFLVIAPSSTLHNWQQEIEKFCPELKVLPYWGNVKERRLARKNWNPAKLYNKDSQFHVCVTSYGLILEDEKLLNRLKWQYLILDEAHQIKSSKSSRWNTLLHFKCRNRLLLTGTPIQNNMAELWSLLHFIMPSLFDSHQEFDDWFSKDIESHAEQKGSLNPQQLARLHMILKPFMLRRVKKDVETEMAPKIEQIVYCSLSSKQKQMYKALKEQFSRNPKMATLISSDQSKKTLMNFVMQFRKVCSHPELFEKQETEFPFLFQCPSPFTIILPPEVSRYPPEIYSTQNNLIEFNIPKCFHRDGMLGLGPDIHPCFTGDIDHSIRFNILYNKFSIFTSEYIHHSIFPSLPKGTENKKLYLSNSCFSFARFIDMSPGELAFAFNAGLLERYIMHLNQQCTKERLHYYSTESQKDYPSVTLFNQARFLIEEIFRPTSSVHTRSLSLDKESRDMWNHLVISDPEQRITQHRQLIREIKSDSMVKVVAPPIRFYCPDISFMNKQSRSMLNRWAKYVLLHMIPSSKSNKYQPKKSYHFNFIHRSCGVNANAPFSNYTPPDVQRPGLLSLYHDHFPSELIRQPSVTRMVAASGKLQVLDRLLRDLKAKGHRTLIFSQMTKMLNIIEDFMSARHYTFFRFDGQTSISDRQYMVKTFQSNPNIFAFLLSTRAGGLGINLTAADTVIFYESDWNPTLDAQAMDRVHRIGQTRQVSVYRLVMKGTVEERILKIAQQKNTIQDTVYSGHFKADSSDEPSTTDVMSVLLDDLEMDQWRVTKQQQQQTKRGKKKSSPSVSKRKAPNKKKRDTDEEGARKRKRKNTSSQEKNHSA